MCALFYETQNSQNNLNVEFNYGHIDYLEFSKFISRHQFSAWLVHKHLFVHS